MAARSKVVSKRSRTRKSYSKRRKTVYKGGSRNFKLQLFRSLLRKLVEKKRVSRRRKIYSKRRYRR